MRFPDYADSKARDKIADLERLSDRTLTNTEYIDGRQASRLLATLLGSYRDAVQGGALGEFDRVRDAFRAGEFFPLVLAAAFDLVTNVEYLHGRVVNSKWIYCHREGETPAVYYSFLKQCPRCCLDRGLEPRLSGAQHKPTSHHIGEITTVVSALILQLIANANAEPLAVATITKQSHDVDAIGFRERLLLLFEIKASPMVTYPLVAELASPMMTEREGEPVEYAQHSLVDVTLEGRDLALAIPHRGWNVPLGEVNGAAWPYESAIRFFSEEGNFLQYLGAWLELYEAYRVPKTQREGKLATRAYLVNGWGDEIDSNKTKPGLGRTDDIKKGTYQLLKFGSYYRDDASELDVRGALVANLDPLFLREDYIDGLSDVRWGRGADFELVDGQYRIREDLLRYLYDGVLTFNAPVLNDPILRQVFDLRTVAKALQSGDLDEFLSLWADAGPDKTARIIAEDK